MVGTFRGLVADSSLPGVRGRHQGGLRCNCENTVSSKGSWDVRAKSLPRHQTLPLQTPPPPPNPPPQKPPPPNPPDENPPPPPPKNPPPLLPPLKIELIRIPPSTAPKMSLPPPRRPPIPSPKDPAAFFAAVEDGVNKNPAEYRSKDVAAPASTSAHPVEDSAPAVERTDILLRQLLRRCRELLCPLGRCESVCRIGRREPFRLRTESSGFGQAGASLRADRAAPRHNVVLHGLHLSASSGKGAAKF